MNPNRIAAAYDAFCDAAWDAECVAADRQQSLLENEAEREMVECEEPFADWVTENHADALPLLASYVIRNKTDDDHLRELRDSIENDWMDYRVNAFTHDEIQRIELRNRND